MRAILLFLALPACTLFGGSGEEDTGYAPPVELAVPDLSGLDLEATWTDAISLNR